MCDSFSIEGEALVTELCTQGGGRCVPCVEAWNDLDIVYTPVTQGVADRNMVMWGLCTLSVYV